MQLTLIRPAITSAPQTIGDLLVNDNFFCNILEDMDRGLYQQDTLSYIQSVKIKHKTAIPYGTYQIIMSYSNRFKKYLPELLEVPGFAGIRIHSGTTAEDTSGCLLTGVTQGNKIINSRTTYSKLEKVILSVIKKEKIFITIKPTQTETTISPQT